MSGSGAGIGMEITVVVGRIIRGAHHRVLAVCVGVVAGVAVPGAAGLRSAAAALAAAALAAAAATSASA